jgi:hypothetical protein
MSMDYFKFERVLFLISSTNTFIIFSSHPLLHVVGTEVYVSLPQLKQPEHEVIHRTPASAMVKNEWRYSPLPLYVSMARTGRNLP